MPAKLTLDFKGLVTAPGQLASPPGSLIQAQNVDFPAPGLAEKRRGVLALTTNPFTTGACWSVITSKALGDKLLFNTGNAGGGSDQAASLQYGDGVVAPTTLATPDAANFTNYPESRMKAEVSLKNHFLTSARAVGRLQSDLTFLYAGLPRPKGIYGAAGTTLAGTGTTWLSNGNGVAYRIVIGTVDPDGVTRLSPPSGRYVISNIATTTGHTGAARSVTIRVMVPFLSDTRGTALTTSYFFQIYRSLQTTVATAQPNDELQLVFQKNFNIGDITAGYVDVNDSCPEAAMGAYLYTNTVSGGDVLTGLVRAGGSGIGIAASNDRPPIAKDVAQYGDCLWYANITTPHRQIVSILGVGAGALAVGDVLSIGGRTYTAVAGAPASAAQFKVELGLASTALNIRQTALNLCEAINFDAGQTVVTATYIGSDATPGTIGRMLFENRRSDDGSFNLGTTGTTTAFLPDLATDTSRQDVWGNGLAISKPFQGDAVPPANYVRVGRNDTVIQRVMALRDALFIFTDDGIYWARGSSPADFAIDRFDTTFRLLARECCVSVGDAVYAWGYEGIARITSGGVEYLDVAIRPSVIAAQRGLVVAQSLDAFSKRAFAVGYRSQRRVVFFFPNGSEDGYACSRAFVFHIQMNAWSTYKFDPENDTKPCGKTAGCIRYSDELMFLGEFVSSGNSYLYQDRNKSDATTDFTDSNDAGNAQAITSVIEWDTVTPSAEQLCHWTEVACYWSLPNITTSLTLPSSVTVACEAEHGGTSSVTIAPSVVQTRIMLSNAVGLAARLGVTVTHNAVDNYFSMSGMSATYSPAGAFNVRGA